MPITPTYLTTPSSSVGSSATSEERGRIATRAPSRLPTLEELLLKSANARAPEGSSQSNNRSIAESRVARSPSMTRAVKRAKNSLDRLDAGEAPISRPVSELDLSSRLREQRDRGNLELLNRFIALERALKPSVLQKGAP